jgi:hypothetical protein
MHVPGCSGQADDEGCGRRDQPLQVPLPYWRDRRVRRWIGKWFRVGLNIFYDYDIANETIADFGDGFDVARLVEVVSKEAA